MQQIPPVSRAAGRRPEDPVDAELSERSLDSTLRVEKATGWRTSADYIPARAPQRATPESTSNLLKGAVAQDSASKSISVAALAHCCNQSRSAPTAGLHVSAGLNARLHASLRPQLGALGGLLSVLLDLTGRVRNTKLPLSQPLLPLFDAVVNSLHAIEALGKSDGRVQIRVLRDDPQAAIEGTTNAPTGFEIVDDGIGFTEDNFQSFLTSDSTQKADLGGKGVGPPSLAEVLRPRNCREHLPRRGWFPSQRTFEFRLSDNGVENHSQSVCSDETPDFGLGWHSLR